MKAKAKSKPRVAKVVSGKCRGKQGHPPNSYQGQFEVIWGSYVFSL